MRNLILVLSIAILLVFRIDVSATESILSRDYPYSIVFCAMAQRGVRDCAALTRCFPDDLVQLQSSGYTTYLIPSLTDLEYVNNGQTAVLKTHNHPVIDGGMRLDPINMAMKMPDQELFHKKQKEVFEQHGVNLERVTKEVKVWHWDGAEWMYQGYSWSDVYWGLLVKRAATHLAFTTDQYILYNNNQAPKSLHDLESFQGAERNPVVWDKINLVSEPSDVEALVGNMYVGWNENRWLIKANMGPEIFEYYREDRGDGTYRVHPSVYVY